MDTVKVLRHAILSWIITIVLACMAGHYHQQVHDLQDTAMKQKHQITALQKDNARLEKQVKEYETILNTPQPISNEWFVGEGKATAYSPWDNQNGIEADGDGRHTSIGLHSGPGVIAVDPKRIPYNSRMIVVYQDGTVETGIAGDTGGALRASRGLHIDMFRKTYDQAVNHGVKPVLILWQKPQKEAG